MSNPKDVPCVMLISKTQTIYFFDAGIPSGFGIISFINLGYEDAIYLWWKKLTGWQNSFLTGLHFQKCWLSPSLLQSGASGPNVMKEDSMGEKITKSSGSKKLSVISNGGSTP